MADGGAVCAEEKVPMVCKKPGGSVSIASRGRTYHSKSSSILDPKVYPNALCRQNQSQAVCLLVISFF